jgi:hypothetical protein
MGSLLNMSVVAATVSQLRPEKLGVITKVVSFTKAWCLIILIWKEQPVHLMDGGDRLSGSLSPQMEDRYGSQFWGLSP